ncbi:MAG: hypothetical protein V3V68_05090 [Nitrosomonadaceae bacterium]
MKYWIFSPVMALAWIAGSIVIHWKVYYKSSQLFYIAEKNNGRN